MCCCHKRGKIRIVYFGLQVGTLTTKDKSPVPVLLVFCIIPELAEEAKSLPAWGLAVQAVAWAAGMDWATDPWENFQQAFNHTYSDSAACGGVVGHLRHLLGFFFAHNSSMANGCGCSRVAWSSTGTSVVPNKSNERKP